MFIAAAASDPVDTFSALAQAIAGILSVPVVVTAFTAIYRFLSPTARLSARLKQEADLFQSLPASPQRDVLAQRIDHDLAILNARYAGAANAGKAAAPRDLARPGAASMTGGPPWTGPVFVIVPAVLGILVIVFILLSGSSAVLTVGVPTLIGAVGTIAFAIAESISGSRSRKRAAEQSGD